MKDKPDDLTVRRLTESIEGGRFKISLTLGGETREIKTMEDAIRFAVEVEIEKLRKAMESQR